jgi:glycosyltransferase involved in cell wall biosynthesis
VKILWLSPWFPYPPVNGSKTRIYHLIQAICSSHQVDLIACIRPGEVYDEAGLDGLVRSIRTVPWKEYRQRSLRATAGYFSFTPRSYFDAYNHAFQDQVTQALQDNPTDLVIASELWTAPYFKAAHRLPAILDDIEIAAIYDQWNDSHHASSKLRNGLTWVKTARYTESLLRNYTRSTVVGSYEKALLTERLSTNKRIWIIPNGVDIQSFQTGMGVPQPGTLIYPGSLTYQANYQAVHFFLSDIYPMIEAAIPGAQFSITGTYANVDLSSLRMGPSVHLTGYLEDIRPAIAGAWVCVVPLLQGSGTRLKILEALALGTPVVTTAKGMQGLELRDEEHLLIADQPEEFARQVIRLHNNPDLRMKLATAGRERVQELYNWDKIGKAFLELVEKASCNAVD